MLAALWWPPELVGFIFLIVYQRKAMTVQESVQRDTPFLP